MMAAPLRFAGYIAADPRFAAFRDKVIDLAELLLPAFQAEGKSHLTIAFGCTGATTVGRDDRNLATPSCRAGGPVSKRHREVEQRRVDAAARGQARGDRQVIGIVIVAHGARLRAFKRAAGT